MRAVATSLLAGFLALRAGPTLAAAAKKGFELQPLKEAAPEGVAEKVRGAIAAEGLRVLDKKGEPFADVWLRKSIPTVEPKQVLGVKLGHLAEGTFLGVIRFHQKSNDFKGNSLPAGVYTMRNGLQPVDGDHQGVSDTRDFVLLAPVKIDTGTDSMTTKEAIKLSVQTAGIKHPSVLWLTKPTEAGAKLPRMVEDDQLEIWILDCEVSAVKEKETVRLGIVLVGKAAEH